MVLDGRLTLKRGLASAVTFTVRVPSAGSYTLNVRYDNGTGGASTHNVSVNGGTATSISYPATVDWGRFGWAQKTVTLNAGTNTIAFTKGTSYADSTSSRFISRERSSTRSSGS